MIRSLHAINISCPLRMTELCIKNQVLDHRIPELLKLWIYCLCLMRNEATDWKTWNPEHWTVDMGEKTDDWKYSQLLKIYWVSLCITIKFFHTWLRKLFLDVFNTLSKIIKAKRKYLSFCSNLFTPSELKIPTSLLGVNYAVNAGEKNFLNMSHKTL